MLLRLSKMLQPTGKLEYGPGGAEMNQSSGLASFQAAVATHSMLGLLLS